MAEPSPPSTPGLGSSVTSKRSIGHARRAPASAPALPAGPDHAHSVRSRPGAAGCAVHSSDTRVPSTPDIAHSTCGHPLSATSGRRSRRVCSLQTSAVDEERLPPTSSRHGGPLEPATVRVVAVGRRCGDQSARPLAPRQLVSARRMRWACRIQVHAAGCCQGHRRGNRRSPLGDRRTPLIAATLIQKTKSPGTAARAQRRRRQRRRRERRTLETGHGAERARPEFRARRLARSPRPLPSALPASARAPRRSPPPCGR